MAAMVATGCPLCSVRSSTAGIASPHSNVSSSRQVAAISLPKMNSSFLGQTLLLQTPLGGERKFLAPSPQIPHSVPSSARVMAARAALGGGDSAVKAVRGFDVSKPKTLRLAPGLEERLALGGGGRDRGVVCMSRRKSQEKRPGKPDPVYRNRLVNLIVNRIMKSGKKSLAYRILYRALKSIKNKTQKNPLLVLRQAVRRATPKVAVKARRVGGSTYQVPIEIKSSQGKALAIRWLLAAARKRPGRTMAMKLSLELLDAARDTGMAIKKREETHRMAEANRAFASFAPR